MKRAGRQSGGQRKRRPRVYIVLGSETGASLVAAILFFVLCGVGASVILAAASASAGKIAAGSRNRPEALCGGIGSRVFAG